MKEFDTKPESDKSGTSASVVIVVVLLVLALPCLAGLALVVLGGAFYAHLDAPRPIPLPPVPGANAPLPIPPGMPTGAITVSEMTWSGNLFQAAEEVLTKGKYDQIQPGMTYDEVLSVLAIPEEKRPPDMELVGPASDVELKWFGGPGDARSITVKMKGKVVTSKDQSGLE